ncbi:hypothetical protein GW916_11820 [bacterium]|nr:hypothetical protein [bacterium]
MIEPTILQYILGTLILSTAILTVLGKNPVMSAMSLMGTLFLTGLLYFTVGAHFVGTVQILIYAGAICVLLIFIVMLLDLKPHNVRIPGRKPVYLFAGGISALFATGLVISTLPALGTNGMLDSGVIAANNLVEDAQSAKAISLTLLSKYMLPFQVTALLLLAAVMGVVVIGQKNKLTDSEGKGS